VLQLHETELAVERETRASALARETIADLRKRVHALEQELASTVAALNETSAQLNAVGDEHVKQVESMRARHNAEVKRLVEEVASLRREAEQSKEQLERLQFTAQHKEQQLRRAQRELDVARAASSAVPQMVRALRAACLCACVRVCLALTAAGGGAAAQEAELKLLRSTMQQHVTSTSVTHVSSSADVSMAEGEQERSVRSSGLASLVEQLQRENNRLVSELEQISVLQHELRLAREREAQLQSLLQSVSNWETLYHETSETLRVREDELRKAEVAVSRQREDAEQARAAMEALQHSQASAHAGDQDRVERMRVALAHRCVPRRACACVRARAHVSYVVCSARQRVGDRVAARDDPDSERRARARPGRVGRRAGRARCSAAGGACVSICGARRAHVADLSSADLAREARPVAAARPVGHEPHGAGRRCLARGAGAAHVQDRRPGLRCVARRRRRAQQRSARA
jgi:hypothetical protein